ncbi:NAD(P)/FAD-dependent oxidoreductase [Nocardioides marmoriginsengisoli]|uniref:NAD(P)/FAD-dependent oxidoreductase n=1 Tax=Nocardioides marmoriginsengisoli TaxID=661483 RepID=A0A3N0CF70_9ACTN|nr:NAD(P)/FAD-dependent oxidoreductase [Nocardioides marmoriginsengisoli]RNL62102.1 NAD(P)/FAD-dependent oxidoreductase [Nocardioides marmoriginsengisoli]
MTTAVVVGSGPNGLAGAVRLAQAGLEVTVLEAAETAGGGARTTERIVPGLLHDDCSAFHPTGITSPYFSTLGLHAHGLRWLWPEVDLAHPLDDGRAGVVTRDFADTDATLGADAKSWRRVFEPLARNFDKIVVDAMGPAVHVPKHPIAFGRFGPQALAPATWTMRHWKDDPARALYTGVAAHAFGRLDTPLSGSVGLMLTAAGHRAGWPVAEGGSQSIANALISLLTSLGGTVRTGTRVTSRAQLRDLVGFDPDVVLLDLAPAGVLDVLGDELPGRVRRAFRRYEYGPAVHKVDYAIEGDVPWTNENCRRAGTLHLGGTAEEIVTIEGATARGEMPERPFALIGQQYLADPSRSAGSINPLWAYAHVPAGYTGDATEALTAQIERFAPGFRDRIVGTFVRSASDMASYNANYVGGDIGAGANNARQILFRPRAAPNPYSLGIKGVYLCSSAAAPGGGVHGMCGFNAAETALKRL